MSLAIAVLPLWAATAQEYYDRGLAAARKAQFEKAVVAFEQALDAGLQSPWLYYNLGIAHYQNGDNRAARQAFLEAAREPELAGLSHYNVGLIARSEDDHREMRHHFARAAKLARTDELRSLAHRALGESPPATGLTGNIEFIGGYDDNAGPSEVAQDSRSEGDSFLGSWVYAEKQLSGQADDGWRLFGNYYGVRYKDLDSARFRNVELGLLATRSMGSWRREIGTAVRHASLGGSGLDQALELSVRVKRALTSGTRLDLKYRLAAIEGGDDYRYLTGSEQAAIAGVAGDHGRFDWGMDYTLEYHDRRDQAVDSEFISYSPVRHWLQARLLFRANTATDVEFRLGRRYSRFRDENVAADGTRVRREDWRTELVASLQRDLGSWDAVIQLEWLDNGSSVERYRYEARRATVGFSRTF